MKRREFIRYGAYGIAAATIGSAVVIPDYMRARTRRVAQGSAITLRMKEVLLEMVDRRPVYHWAFDHGPGPHIPGVTIFTTEGNPIEIELINEMDEEHSFAIPGLVDSGPIPPGATRTINFTAPAGGTYMYLDMLNSPVNRVMGLYGVMIVLPATGNTPYSTPTPHIQHLFDALGDSGTHAELFPGDPWDPSRNWIWCFATVDTNKNRMVQELPPGATIKPKDFTDGYLPDYFLLNGKTGYVASHDPDLFPHGNVGQPAMIRTLNAGLATHSPHIHGNHVYRLTDAWGRLTDNVIELDTWSVAPGEVADILHPFIQPPDAHPWPPSSEAEFPMAFTMHCHTEMSQTAAGGNYPQGLVTDWELRSPQVGGPEADQQNFPFFRGMDPTLFDR